MDKFSLLNYSSASVFPAKLLKHCEDAGKLKPLHVQWMPTNRCNLSCPACSCSGRDKTLEMDFNTATNVMEEFRNLGCISMTITGGGEPLCHPYIAEIITESYSLDISVGLVTNGLLLDSLPQHIVEMLSWCRVSNQDYRELEGSYKTMLQRVVKSTPDVDWAFSHVVSKNPNEVEIRRVIEFASENGFTHVRIVSDLLHVDEIDLRQLRSSLSDMDTNLVIWQNRIDYVESSKCLIGYVKPVVAPDFKMYLCCGVQYALDPPSKDMPAALCMGDARELDKIYKDKVPFLVDCKKCYYSQYNNVLAMMTAEYAHEEFV